MSYLPCLLSAYKGLKLLDPNTGEVVLQGLLSAYKGLKLFLGELFVLQSRLFIKCL